MVDATAKGICRMVDGRTTRSLRAATLEPADGPPSAVSGLPDGHASSASSRVAGPAPGVRLVLARGFELRVDGGLVEIPHSSERLLAFLALTARPVFRGYVAGILWLDRSEDREVVHFRELEVLTAAAGRDVDDAGARVEGDVVPRDHAVLDDRGRRELVERPLVP
jgi:hypothetical protein